MKPKTINAQKIYCSLLLMTILFVLRGSSLLHKIRKDLKKILTEAQFPLLKMNPIPELECKFDSDSL